MYYEKPIFRPMGDRSFLVELGDEISPRVNRSVQELFSGLDKQQSQGILELVPSYRSLMVIYDPLLASSSDVKQRIEEVFEQIGRSQLKEQSIKKIPVVYGGDHGPDLDWVAEYHNLTTEEIVRLHIQPTYRVYMIGFTPGYPYLGEVPKDIVTPRRQTPRTRVPKGSVGIAQKQTGIYSVDSPGGWQIIGWTPVNLFDPLGEPPSYLSMGDQVQFYAITAEEASRWQA